MVACYGIKCIVVQEGRLAAPVRTRYYGYRTHLVPVHGAAAVKTGWSYLCGALFWALFPGSRARDGSFLFKFVCGLVGYSGLFLMFWLSMAANHQRLGHP
jgi:hypothetical protein